MNWQEYEAYHRANYGRSSREELSQDYQKYKQPDINVDQPYRMRSSDRMRSPGKMSTSYNQMRSPLRNQLYLSEVLETMPNSRYYKTNQLKQVMRYEGEGRGSPTRGWGATAPQRGSERHELLQKCGPKSFLEPTDEKFPVMKSLRTTNGRCEYSCEGISAAKNRACQYNHLNIADKAQELGERQCMWSPSRQACPSKSYRQQSPRRPQ